MEHGTVIFSIFPIVAGAAAMATAALFAHPAMIAACSAGGAALGPWCAGFVDDTTRIEDLSRIGINFPPYLAGLDMLERSWMPAEAPGLTLARQSHR